MNNQQRPQVWDRLFDLIYPCDEKPTDDEIDADLKRFGIDMRKANLRLHKMIAEQRARAQFLTAKQTRTTIVDRIRDVVAPRLEDLRAGVQGIIGKTLSGQEQFAYFHKLEKAASEDDLQSLMDDLEKLAAIRELGKQNDSQTK